MKQFKVITSHDEKDFNRKLKDHMNDGFYPEGNLTLAKNGSNLFTLALLLRRDIDLDEPREETPTPIPDTPHPTQ